MEKFSYLILTRTEPAEAQTEKVDWARLIAPVLRRKRHVHCQMCCPDGQLQHLVVTASKHSRWHLLSNSSAAAVYSFWVCIYCFVLICLFIYQTLSQIKMMKNVVFSIIYTFVIHHELQTLIALQERNVWEKAVCNWASQILPSFGTWQMFQTLWYTCIYIYRGFIYMSVNRKYVKRNNIDSIEFWFTKSRIS